jgi:hypothetical protein
MLLREMATRQAQGGVTALLGNVVLGADFCGVTGDCADWSFVLGGPC